MKVCDFCGGKLSDGIISSMFTGNLTICSKSIWGYSPKYDICTSCIDKLKDMRGV
jgi:hypothetical protein